METTSNQVAGKKMRSAVSTGRGAFSIRRRRQGNARFAAAVLALGITIPMTARAGTVVGNVINFHDANQGYGYYGGYDSLYYGQGAVSDPGNNVWNGFGTYQGPDTVGVFYGNNNPSSAHGSVPANNPGNPYAWYGGTTTTGPNLFVPSATPATSGFGNAYSNGKISPITLSMSYGGDNGSTNGATQGSPSFLLSYAALTSSSTTPGTFTLGSVPAGTYDLYLYGSNYDGTRGATFGLGSANGGTAVNGITSATNPNATPAGPLNTFVLGQDYVEFTGVTPDSSGNISGTWSALSNSISGLGGEGDFNGLQLVQIINTGSLYVYYGYDSFSNTTANSTFGGTGTNFNNGGSSTVAFSNGSTGSTAIFDDTAPGSHSVTIVSGGVAPSQTQFNNSTSTYTITGGPIIGPGGLSVTGGGVVTLANSNSYTGQTQVTLGTLILANGSVIASPSVSISPGGILSIPGGSTPGSLSSTALAVVDYGTINLGGSYNLGSLTGNGIVNINASGSTLTLTGGSFSGSLNANGSNLKLAGTTGTYSGSITDGSTPNSLTVISTGAWNITGNNSFTGGTTVKSGSALGGPSGFSTGPVSLQGGAIGGASGVTALVPGIVSGTPLIVAGGGGTLELSGSNTFTGPISIQGSSGSGTTAIAGGTLKIDIPASLSTSTVINVASGGSFEPNDTNAPLGTSSITVNITGLGAGNNGALRGPDSAAVTWAGNTNVSGSATISAGNGSSMSLTGPITGSGSVLFGSNVNDAGPSSSIILAPATAGASTFSGETQVTSDYGGFSTFTLQLANNNAISTASGVNFIYGPNSGATTGTLDLNGYNQSTPYLAGTNNSSYVITSVSGAASTLTVTSGLRGGVPAFLGTTIAGNVSLVMNDPTGLGNQVLSGTNTYTGGTTITKGTLTAASASALGTGTVSLNGGTLALTVPGTPVAGTAIITPGSFVASNFTLNNFAGAAPSFSGSALTLTTNGTGNTANSAFYNTKVPVSDALGFTVTFNYNVSAGYADGITFLLQNDPRGASAVSTGAGGSLAYAGTGQITKSAAVAFEIYPFASTFGTTFETNGLLPQYAGAASNAYNSTAPVNIGTQNIGGTVFLDDPSPIDVTLVYNGPAQTLTETLFSDTENTTYSITYSGIDYSSILGGTPGGNTTAYIGFTAATGGASSTQIITNFNYSQNLAYTATAATTTPQSIGNLVTAATGTTSYIQLGVSSSASTTAGVGGINISTGATINLNVSSGVMPRGVLFTPTLSIASAAGAFTGKLDLGFNDLVITGNSLTLAQVTAMVASGYNKGAWTGEGIASRAAAASTSHLTALGVIVNDNGSGSPLYGGTNATISPAFDGSVPTDGNILVKYTYYGDTNLDGAVDGTDYSRIDAAYAAPGTLTGWYNGDFNYDGVINGSDYTLIDNTFNQQGGSLGSNPLAQVSALVGSSAVPEPASLSLIAIASAGLLSRRKRQI